MISSCSSVDYVEVPKALYQTIKGVDFEITDSFIQSKEFSFIKINIGRNIAATMTLFNVKKGIYEWIGADSSQRIFTKDGKIIKTIGLDHDIEILNSSNISIQSDDSSGEYLVRFYEPTGMFSQKFHKKKKDFLQYSQPWFRSSSQGLEESGFQNEPIFVIEENFSTEVYWWDEKNTYWIDENQNVVKSEQFIHPYLPKITIHYFYKY